ncbi:MAG: substrate-binding domain-containing protein, partial [Comamonadaceae bacterium]|nr:substrate-binding domain-containing protein [Comamonadaceae bacterium]
VLVQLRIAKVNLVTGTQDSSTSIAAQAAAALLQKYPDTAGIACVEAAGGTGSATAVRGKKTGQVKIVAMDRGNEILQLIKEGVISATVVQQTALMPFYATQILYNLNNHSVPITNDNAKAHVSGAGRGMASSAVSMVDRALDRLEQRLPGQRQLLQHRRAASNSRCGASGSGVFGAATGRRDALRCCSDCRSSCCSSNQPSSVSPATAMPAASSGHAGQRDAAEAESRVRARASCRSAQRQLASPQRPHGRARRGLGPVGVVADHAQHLESQRRLPRRQRRQLLLDGGLGVGAAAAAGDLDRAPALERRTGDEHGPVSTTASARALRRARRRQSLKAAISSGCSEASRSAVRA